MFVVANARPDSFGNPGRAAPGSRRALLDRAGDTWCVLPEAPGRVSKKPPGGVCIIELPGPAKCMAATCMQFPGPAIGDVPAPVPGSAGWRMPAPKLRRTAPPGTKGRCPDGSVPRSTRLPANARTVAGLPALPSTTPGGCLLAAARGRESTRENRGELLDLMSRDQIAEAQKLSREMDARIRGN